jgi:beta-lactamase regulating signal transducer with metallopeptidase domain
MNALSFQLLAALLRSGVVLTASALLLPLVLRLFKVASPTLRRVAIVAVLLQGALLVQIPIPLPVSTGVLAMDGLKVEQFPLLLSPPLALQPVGEARQFTKPDAAASRAAKPTQVLRSPSQTSFPWAPALAALWGAGIVAICSRTAWIYARFVHKLRPLPDSDGVWAAEWMTLQRNVGLRTLTPLVIVDNAGPLLCRLPQGYRLIVPAIRWEKLNSAQRLSVLRHELAHIQRRDVWKSLFVCVLALPHWFNPLVWRLANRFDECAEWACDEAARSAAPEHLPDYARALVELAQRIEPVTFSTGVASQHGLSDRIHRLLSLNPPQESKMKAVGVGTFAVGLSLLSVLNIDVRADGQQKGTPVEGVVLKTEKTGVSIHARGPGRLFLKTDKTGGPATFQSTDLTIVTDSNQVLTVVAPKPGPSNAVLDVGYVLNNLKEFKRDREQLKARIKMKDESLTKKNRDLETLKERLATFNETDENDRLLMHVLKSGIDKMRRELEEDRKAGGQELVKLEARIYRKAYNKIVSESARYAKEHGIHVIRRKERSTKHNDAPRPATSQSAEMMERMGQEFLYVERDGQHEIDISDEIVKRVNAADSVTEKKKSQSPPAPEGRIAPGTDDFRRSSS